MGIEPANDCSLQEASNVARSAIAPQAAWYNPLGRRLALVIGAPSMAQLLGSAFNIWYNFTYIRPLLSAEQLSVFLGTVVVFNAVVYPVGAALWIWTVLVLHRPCQKLLHNQPISADRLLKARQRVINLPWWGMAIAGILWLFCIPVFLLTLFLAPGSLNPRIWSDLPISFIVAALIATTHSFFSIELLTQQLLYPILFQDARPAQTPGTFPLNLRWRWVFLAFCGSICPIASLLLLVVAPHTCEQKDAWFAIAVGTLGILFSLTSAWMVSQLVIEPIKNFSAWQLKYQTATSKFGLSLYGQMNLVP